MYHPSPRVLWARHTTALQGLAAQPLAPSTLARPTALVLHLPPLHRHPPTCPPPVTPVTPRHSPAHALHFAVYELAKERLGANRAGLHPLETAAAGCVATVVNDALMTPVDSVKQRCQVGLGACT